MQVTNLKAYLANIGMSVSQFSKMVECDPQYLSMIISGRRKPGRRFAKELTKATNNVIKFETNPRKAKMICIDESKIKEA